ncbi:hypothetical protein KR093_003196 [Drosophila rubida]|uniref:CHK kinase-like domain-containing protein n=1 Tax=Drosophila rubida TaxID=30044 RepID=A0AAD4PG81_9MUSC|nr:hypothetical protein KR093_003196 [Drosophila rubida]
MASTQNNDDFNADELVAPAWLNAEFFREVLSNHLKEPELRVLNVEMSPASAKGDHYASVMFRSKVAYETQRGKFSKSLIIKTMPEQEGHKKEMLNNSRIFETEIGMYTKALPKFEEILRQSGDDTKLCTSCLYHSLEPRQIMIFDDLVVEGYKVIRDRRPTIEELKAAYTRLAKIHAVSFKILNEVSLRNEHICRINIKSIDFFQNPEYLKEFKNGVNSLPNFLNDPFVTTGITNLLELIDTVPEFAKYKPYFKSIEKTYINQFVDIVEEYRSNRQSDGYYILCHGDFHSRNMMFKHNPISGDLEDCMLLDYQMSNVCPISVDILYSIYVLMGPDERRNHDKELINFYFNTFVETLEKIGFKGEIPNYVDFWRQLHRHKIFEMFYLNLLPMGIAAEAKEADLADMLTNSEVRKKVYFLDGFIEELKYLLPRYEKLGYFK